MCDFSLAPVDFFRTYHLHILKWIILSLTSNFHYLWTCISVCLVLWSGQTIFECIINNYCFMVIIFSFFVLLYLFLYYFIFIHAFLLFSLLHCTLLFALFYMIYILFIFCFYVFVFFCYSLSFIFSSNPICL